MIQDKTSHSAVRICSNMLKLSFRLNSFRALPRIRSGSRASPLRYNYIGEFISEARKLRKININQFSYMTGIPRNKIHQIEKGNLIPQNDYKKQIERTLNISTRRCDQNKIGDKPVIKRMLDP